MPLGKTGQSIRAWLRLHDAGDQSAWSLLWRSAMHASRNIGARLGLDSQERYDLAAETVVRAFEDQAAPLRRANPSVKLGAWVRGTARNIAVEQLRSKSRALGPASSPELDSHTYSPCRSAPSSARGWDDADLTGLTTKQRAAVQALLRARSFAQASRDLGISVSALRERIERGIRRLHRPREDPRDCDWARSLLASGLVQAESRLLLQLHSSGMTHRQVGAAMGLSRAAVRARLRRLRRRQR